MLPTILIGNSHFVVRIGYFTKLSEETPIRFQDEVSDANVFVAELIGR